MECISVRLGWPRAATEGVSRFYGEVFNSCATNIPCYRQRREVLHIRHGISIHQTPGLLPLAELRSCTFTCTETIGWVRLTH
ncbi:hypothetical protein PoB_006138300 [Plakobranchus ocellatus]|uniref:Uncharacterized protein n=1 Tax=Plakobranchus ocellatus TaxID=259542 RepID=A0AAV4CSQ2_9GAST|nr:hypothetical protein PoB_006138300 [Plakobranchus ocellatus]